MAIVSKLHYEERNRLKEMGAYIEKIRALSEEEAKKSAMDALKRTGVVGKNGKIKEKIVSWE